MALYLGTTRASSHIGNILSPPMKKQGPSIMFLIMTHSIAFTVGVVVTWMLL